MATHKWETRDGFIEEHRLIEYPAGRIVGRVSGSNYSRDDFQGWSAMTYLPDGQYKSLGIFVTPDMAKKAVSDSLKIQNNPNLERD